MYFRFAAGLLLVVLVSTVGTRLEKQTLELRRSVSVQYYQTDLLLELQVRLRLETQRLTAPAQLAATAENSAKAQKSTATTKQRSKARVAEQTNELPRREKTELPLLRFQQPFSPEGID